MGGVSVQQEMVTTFAAREVLASGDKCFSQSNCENREGMGGAICTYYRKNRFSTKGLEDYRKSH